MKNIPTLCHHGALMLLLLYCKAGQTHAFVLPNKPSGLPTRGPIRVPASSSPRSDTLSIRSPHLVAASTSFSPTTLSLSPETLPESTNVVSAFFGLIYLVALFLPEQVKQVIPESALAPITIDVNDSWEPTLKDIFLYPAAGVVVAGLLAKFGSEDDSDLIIGFYIVVAAVTPYLLGIFFPKKMNQSFFLPIYDTLEDPHERLEEGKEVVWEEYYTMETNGRKAEIAWKLRYAALGLALLTLAVGEVYFFTDRNADQIIRDSYVVWAIFYTDAIYKIRKESRAGILGKDRRFIQLWHTIVVVVLYIAAGTSPIRGLIDSLQSTG